MDADTARQELYAVMRTDGSFEEKAERALEIGERYLDVENGHVARIDRDSDFWQAIASTDPEGGTYPPGQVLDLQTTYCRRTAAGESPVALDDAPAQGWADDPAFEEHGLHCYHGTTISLDGEPYGTVCFVASEPRPEPFTDAETMFAELVARMLEHELQRRRTETKIERLQQFADVLSHDLRNPMSVARGHLERAREADDSEHLATVAESLDRMDALVGDLLTMSRQGNHVTQTEAVALTAVVEGCWQSVATGDATLVVEGELTFQADRTRVRQLFENLFRNAVEHGSPTVTVTVGALADGGFYVEDDGPGIPESARDQVFDIGYTTDGEGLGIGLSIVKGVAAAHDWELSVAEGADGGARFEVQNVVAGGQGPAP